jgi:hypothetical protein
MENEIVVRRGGYMKALMILAAILFFTLSGVLYFLFDRSNLRLYLVGGVFTDLFGAGCVLYVVALFSWRIRIAEDSIYVRVWYRGETKYDKSQIIIADAGVKNFLPNDNGEKVLGTHYVIWSKLTETQITDVYDKDINSQYIKNMCVDK